MQLTCPNCGTIYEVPENAIGANGRKIRCRACETSWFEPAREATPLARSAPPPPPVMAAPRAPIAEGSVTKERPIRPVRRGPWILLALVILVVLFGGVAATVMMGPQQVASRLGISENRVPLGISITREPDWRMIAGGSQLFAVTGRIWNPTKTDQPVPDIRAELKNGQGKIVYRWTIRRPVVSLAPGAAADFDGAAVDVPASSSNISVSFAGADTDH